MASSARPRGRQVNAYQLIALLLAFVLVSGVGGVLAAGLVIPLAAGASTVTDNTVQVFEDLPEDLEPGPLSEQSRIYANDGKTLLARFYTENRIVVPLADISKNMQNAVVATEDMRFYEHGGIDVQGTVRAAVNNAIDPGSKQGASGLTQQYVKNVLIEQALRANDPLAVLEAKDDTVQRKLREAKLAIALEKRMSKDQILEGYLNIAEFGVRVSGVETASRRYFNKSAKDLTIVEAATIAGVTKAPTDYDPISNPANAQGRRNTVLNQMYAQNFITKAEYDTAIATPIADTLHVQDFSVGCQSAGSAAFFCDYVTKVITSDPAFGETPGDRQALLYRGGLDITTTIDLTKQAAADENVKAAVPPNDPSGIEDAIVSVEPGTGKILAMAQNRPYDASSEAAPGTTAQNYSVDQAHGSSHGFSPGSTFKPFVLSEWLKSGRTLNDTINANKRAWNNTDFDFCGAGVVNDRKPWSPSNSDGRTDSGNISVLRATYNSINTGYANMESQLRLCDIKATTESIGYQPAITNEIKGGVQMMPSMVLGTQNSSPLQMAAAYATFASGGTYCQPIAITKVVGADGKELPVPSANCNPNALDPRVANTVTFALTNVMTQGSGIGAQLDGRPSAGKTGTANLNTHNWFIGYTPQLVTAVWIGNAEELVQMRDFTINGVWKPVWFGSDLAAPTWRNYMNTVLAGTPAQQFPAPDPGMVGQPKPPVQRPASTNRSDDRGDDKGNDNKGNDQNNGGNNGGNSGGNSGGNGGNNNGDKD